MVDIDRQRTAEQLHALAALIETTVSRPYGPEAVPDVQKAAGDACVRLCGGNADQARTLWREITGALSYMPHCVAHALQQAASTNLVPDVEAPEESW